MNTKMYIPGETITLIVSFPERVLTQKKKDQLFRNTFLAGGVRPLELKKIGVDRFSYTLEVTEIISPNPVLPFVILGISVLGTAIFGSFIVEDVRETLEGPGFIAILVLAVIAILIIGKFK